MDYFYYVLAVLIVGLVCVCIVRFATRSQNPDLVAHYESRMKAARQAKTLQKAQVAMLKRGEEGSKPFPAIKSLRERHQAKLHHRTPWGWPGSGRQAGSHGVSETVRNFTDRLVKEKQLAGAGGNGVNGSIRALLEDRYCPVNRGMSEIPYQKVKRPLLRDPAEEHDQMDNLGSAETRRMRQKLQFLSAMNQVDDKSANNTKPGGPKKVEFRYVELKDIKQPWGW